MRAFAFLLFFALTLSLPPISFASGTVLIGTQSVVSSSDTDRPGQAEAFQFAATSNGTVSSLSLYLDSSSSATTLIVGLYSSSGQNPGSLLGQGSSTSLTPGAWNAVPIAPVTVTAGTVYWISILGTGGTLAFRDTGTNCISQSSSQSNLTSLPATWSVGSHWSSCTLSAYGTSSSSSPILSVSPSSVAFNATQGSGTNPAPATANVSNTGAGTLSFTATSDSPWLSATPASGSVPGSLQISASLGSLTAATYTGHITVTSSGAQGSPATVAVTFTVAAPAPSPILSVSPSSLTFSATQGSGNNPPPANLSVANSGGGSLSFTASSDSSWLSVSPSSGTAPLNLQASAFPGTLLAGTYTGHLIVTSSGVQGSPASVKVSLVVSPQDVAPLISGVSASSITSSGAIITWTTDKASTSQVNYGATTAYGSSTSLNSTLVTSHSVTLTGLTASTVYHYQVQSADSAGSLSGSPDGTFTTTSSSASSCPCSIWSVSATPRNSSVNDNHAVELGVKFTSDVSGFITGIRFYKGSQNTGTHSGSLWTTSGTLLASATFAGETNSGWQQVNFSSPVAINANTTYVASYHTNAGFYAGDTQFFATSPVNLPPLHALANSSSSGDGVYVYGSGGAFPNSTYQSTNYWVDVVFNTQAVQSGSIYSISGTITGGSGATVTMSGASSASTTPNSSGAFSFTGLANGSYTITPSKAGTSFSPASQSVTVSNASVTGVSFTATALTYSVSGALSPSTGGGGATLTLSGAASATSTSSGTGSYSFAGLPNGIYAVTPSNLGYNFSPTTQSVTVNSANVTGVNFTASVAATTYTLSGSITPASAGAGALVTLSGMASSSTTADASGSYSFTTLGNGSYTVTPSSTTATFSPASQTVTISSANVSGVNFTATATSNVIFFDDFVGTTLGSQWVAMNRAGDYSNGEEECYSPANAIVSGGFLVEQFLAKSVTCGDSLHAASQFNYSSAMVEWSTFNFTYGTVEVRAKIPNTTLWPAIWMLGANCQASNVLSADNTGSCNWPVSGSDEIDIAEFAPNDATARENSYANSSQSNSSTNNFSCGSGPQVGGDGNYHVYTFTWSATKLSWAVDGTTNCTTTTSKYIPTKPMFVMMNIAANNSATPGGLPQTMSIDYVKVTQP